MKWMILMGALLPQENVAPTPDLDPALLPESEDAAPAQAPSVTPWDGTLAQGMGEVLRLAAAQDVTGALALSDRLLAPDGYARWRARLEESGGLGARLVARFDRPLTWLGLERLPAADRAEVRFARGLLRARQSAPVDADTELELVRALAGPGELRAAAVYALGVLDLRTGEELRQKIPEVSGAQPAPPGPPAPGAQEPPDPLGLARAAYLDARAHLVERLRLDWDDADTRANAELCLRRLRELDEIERQRQQRQGQDQQPPPEGQEGEPQPDPDAPPPEDQQEGEQEGEPTTPEQPLPEEPAEQDQAEPAQPPAERYLTAEEMKQLLEVLHQHQQAGEELETVLRGARRPRTDRDW